MDTEAADDAPSERMLTELVQTMLVARDLRGRATSGTSAICFSFYDYRTLHLPGDGKLMGSAAPSEETETERSRNGPCLGAPYGLRNSRETLA